MRVPLTRLPPVRSTSGMKKLLADLKPMGQGMPTYGKEAERGGHSTWRRLALASAFQDGT